MICPNLVQESHSLSGPEDARRNTTARRTEENEPFHTVSVIQVKTCAVGRKADSSDDESSFDAYILDDAACEPARDDHEAKGESIAGVDQIRLLSTTCAEGVHGAPEAGSCETAHAEDRGVVKNGAVPFCWTC
ncbi:hypothetical protein HG530_013675 [Fusarium avenaceum]|nr:hypothetical protein HG530_013675 [Fusarium avenaceum]